MGNPWLELGKSRLEIEIWQPCGNQCAIHGLSFPLLDVYTIAKGSREKARRSQGVVTDSRCTYSRLLQPFRTDCISDKHVRARNNFMADGQIIVGIREVCISGLIRFGRDNADIGALSAKLLSCVKQHADPVAMVKVMW